MVKYWEQPTLTENGTMGGSTFAVAASSTQWEDSAHAWNAFNGQLWHGNNSSTQWLSWYFPEPMILESVMIQNRWSSGTDVCAPTKYTIQASLDNSTWYDLTDLISNPYVEGGIWHPEIVIPEYSRIPFKYYRIYITGRYGSYTAINHIKIKAYNPLDSSDSRPKYWAGWYQPEMHSSTDYGRILATSWLNGYEPWRAVEHKTYTEQPYGWATWYHSRGAWQWSFPKTLKIHRIIFFNRISPTEDPKVVFEEGQFFGAKGEFGEKFVVQHSRQQVIIDYEGGMETNYLYFEKLGGINSGIGQLIIDAEEEKETLGRQFASELKEVYSEGKSCSKIYHYGKLIWEKPQPEPEAIPEYYEVPVLTENGAVGGEEFAVEQSSCYGIDLQAYQATNPESSRWQSHNQENMPQWITYYFPIPVAVESLTFNNFIALDDIERKRYTPDEYQVYGSNDNLEWHAIASYANTDYTWTHVINCREYYKYIRVLVTSTMGNLSPVMIGHLNGKFRIN